MNEQPKTFVLVHGAWHGAWCWEKIVPLLETRGHTVITPDLPGHGDDSTPVARISLKTYCQALTRLLEETPGKVVLVGHSMGGMVISQTADRMPDKIHKLVYLAAFLPRDKQSVFDLMAANKNPETGTPTKARVETPTKKETGTPAGFTEAETRTPIEKHMLMSADKRTCSIDSGVLASLFYNRSPDADIRRAVTRVAPQATLPLSGKVKLTEGNFPRLSKVYLCCQHDQVIPLKHQRRMIARQPCDEMLQLEADHSPFFSAPGQLAEILDSL